MDNCAVDINAISTGTGNTALHYSISKKAGMKSLQCMKLLLERGADQNRWERQVYHWNAFYCFTECWPLRGL